MAKNTYWMKYGQKDGALNCMPAGADPMTHVLKAKDHETLAWVATVGERYYYFIRKAIYQDILREDWTEIGAASVEEARRTVETLVRMEATA
jgi:hypothetical protein